MPETWRIYFQKTAQVWLLITNESPYRGENFGFNFWRAMHMTVAVFDIVGHGSIQAGTVSYVITKNFVRFLHHSIHG